MIIRILPPIQLVEGVDKNVRRYAEFGKAPPDPSGLAPPTAIAAEGLTLHDQEIYVRLLVRLATSPGTEQKNPLRIDLADNPPSHPVDQFLGDTHHNDPASA
jgi:hypothetical protein